MPTLPQSPLRIAILDNPYDCMENPKARDLWAKVIALKIAGYRSEYPYGVLPVDTSDFYATHMVVYTDSADGSPEPVLVCKNISLARHEAFSGEEFMLVEHFQKSAAAGHLQAIRDWVAEAKQSGRSLHYFGSYTTNPNLRGDKEFSVRLKEVFLAMHVNFHLSYNVDISTCAGAKKFKVDQMLYTWGYHRLALKGDPLPDYNPACIFGGEATFFATETFSDYAHSIAKKHRALWDQRLEFSAGTAAAPLVKAA